MTISEQADGRIGEGCGSGMMRIGATAQLLAAAKAIASPVPAGAGAAEAAVAAEVSRMGSVRANPMVNPMGEAFLADTNPMGSAVVAEAIAWVGTPYRHQGRRKGVGCDCLGLIIGVWEALVGSLPEEPGAYAPDWAEAGGHDRFLAAAGRYFEKRRGGQMEAGDILLFRWRPHLPAKHAGILADPGHFIHAYEGASVTVSPLVPQWRRRIAGAFSFPEPERLSDNR